MSTNVDIALTLEPVLLTLDNGHNQSDSTITLAVTKTADFTLSFAEQGPPGPPGPPGGGSGVTYAQDAEPVAPDEHSTWWNPLNYTIQVYYSGSWEPVSPDGGYF
jgi:hypothetical protein